MTILSREYLFLQIRWPPTGRKWNPRVQQGTKRTGENILPLAGRLADGGFFQQFVGRRRTASLFLRAQKRFLRSFCFLLFFFALASTIGISTQGYARLLRVFPLWILGGFILAVLMSCFRFLSLTCAVINDSLSCRMTTTDQYYMGMKRDFWW